MKMTFITASIVIVLLTLTFQESKVTSQETCNYMKWMICEKGMSAKVNLPKYVRVENFLCDTESDGGGWIIFQRRFYQDTRFDRGWEDYKKGFGSKCNDHWLGNDYLHIATKYGQYELRIDMTYEGQYYFAQYSNFKIDSKSTNYKLTVEGFHGNVTGSDFIRHNNYSFTTKDFDNSGDDECGIKFKSGWWFHACHNGNLNGDFQDEDYGYGVNWPSLTGDYESLSTVEMKLRIKK